MIDNTIIKYKGKIFYTEEELKKFFKTQNLHLKYIQTYKPTT